MIYFHVFLILYMFVFCFYPFYLYFSLFRGNSLNSRSSLDLNLRSFRGNKEKLKNKIEKKQ